MEPKIIVAKGNLGDRPWGNLRLSDSERAILAFASGELASQAQLNKAKDEGHYQHDTLQFLELFVSKDRVINEFLDICSDPDVMAIAQDISKLRIEGKLQVESLRERISYISRPMNRS